MINAISTKLEIDVMQLNELDQAMQLAAIHRLPAVIIHPQLATQAMTTRIRRNGKFKIITTIDWPKGDIYGLNKLRGLTRDLMEVDGYEILLTGGKSEIENRNEAKTIADFIRNNINKNMEVRFVLGCFIRPESEIVTMAKVMKDIPAPALIRVDTHLRMQVTKANLKTHTSLVESLRAVCGLPLKLSGNIDNLRTIAGCLRLPAPPAKLAVNLQQLQQIIKDFQKQPEELRALISTATESDQPEVSATQTPVQLSTKTAVKAQTKTTKQKAARIK